MKKVLFTLIILTSINNFAQKNKNAVAIIDKYIAMHNDGSDEAIKSFIKETYDPSLYSKIKKIDRHVDFYKNGINDFGDLNPKVYEVYKETPTKIIVYLIKEKDDINNKKIDPRYILSMEIDLSPKNPKYLSRGLGLGALVCTIK